MKQNSLYFLCFLSLASVIHGVEPVEESGQLPEFGDHELEIFQIVGQLGLYVWPAIGDTTNMDKLSLGQLEEFLTFAVNRKKEDLFGIDEIGILHDITNPTVIVDSRRRSGLSDVSEINKYVVRADALLPEYEVEIHVREVIRSDGQQSYLVYVIQKMNGLFENLIVLGGRGQGEGYRRNMNNWSGADPQK